MAGFSFCVDGEFIPKPYSEIMDNGEFNDLLACLAAWTPFSAGYHFFIPSTLSGKASAR